ncbi:hypothetical protein GCM10023346_22650 [Arthrobacter gyeryongensis]|uniref:Secreted protein n=1 Tax=Arthrobacter gyeryongensis TaxID=1650592 RepID=A0ABP9SFJ8_9MICC
MFVAPDCFLALWFSQTCLTLRPELSAGPTHARAFLCDQGAGEVGTELLPNRWSSSLRRCSWWSDVRTGSRVEEPPRLRFLVVSAWIAARCQLLTQLLDVVGAEHVPGTRALPAIDVPDVLRKPLRVLAGHP